MRLLIVGVGQTLNFETREMEDVLQVLAPDGSVFSVPTTNGAAQGLVKIAMNGNGHQEDLVVSDTAEMPPEPVWESSSPDLEGVVGDSSEEVFPGGAEVFGGLGDAQIFAKTERTKQSSSSLGRTRNATDRSGVPSYGISRVDERGNPVLPAARDFVDDEDDPGEQA